MNKPNTLEEKTVKLVTEIKNGQTVATEIQNLAGTEKISYNSSKIYLINQTKTAIHIHKQNKSIELKMIIQ